MRLLKIALIAALPLVVSGCNTLEASRAAIQVLLPLVPKVQQKTKEICGYVPTVKTIADIFMSDNQKYNKVSSIAVAICDAVTTNPKAEGPGGRKPPMVNGVAIRGRFIR